MTPYEDICHRITRQVVPLPILFLQDYSIDHAGLAKYVTWHAENGTQILCLTFTYSQLDFVTAEEIEAITHTVQQTVGNDLLFIPCTRGGSIREAIDLVQKFEKAGAPAAFVHLPEHCLQNSFQAGELYLKYIQDVAQQTELPLLAVALPVPGSTPLVSMLPASRIEELCELEQFIGIKDDIYILENRMELIRKFDDRLCIIGGGLFNQYIHFHHCPNQSEFVGIYNPQRGQRMLQLLDENNYLDVLKMMEEENAQPFPLAQDLHWMARNQVIFYGMGFAETYLMRSPIASATEQQAEAIIESMRQLPTHFERVTR